MHRARRKGAKKSKTRISSHYRAKTRFKLQDKITFWFYPA